MRLLVTLPVLFRYRLRVEDDDGGGGGGRLTYPSDGVSCLLGVAELTLLALRWRCRASACSNARRLEALSDVADEGLRCLLRLLSRDTGGLNAADVGASLMASVDSTSGTVDRRSGVRMMESRWATGSLLLACLVGDTAIVLSIFGGWVTASGGESRADC